MPIPSPVNASEVRAQRAEHGQPCAAQGYEVLSVALAGLAGGSVQVIFRGPCYGFAVIAGNFPNVLLSTGRIRQAGAIGTVPAFRANLGTCVYLASTRDGLPPASMITIRVPTGETGTLELAVATEPTACLERFHATVLFDETGAIIEAANPLDVTLRAGTNVSQNVSIRDVSGTAQTARDWSGDLDNLQGIPPDQALTAQGARLKVAALIEAFISATTTTALGINATFNGSTQNQIINAAGADFATGGGTGICRSTRGGAMVFADQAGTLNFEESIAQITFRDVATVAITANTPRQASQDYLGIFYARITYDNGGVAQTVFELSGVLAPMGA